MNLLAFDTSTETLSIAVQRGNGTTGQVFEHTSPGGAQASLHLIPAILTLLAEAGLATADLDAIAFGCGPGSFTGLRTACSVAQGLALGAGVAVLPVDSLMAVAEEARYQLAQERRAPDSNSTAGAAAESPQPCKIIALLDARMDELYVGYFKYDSKLWSKHGDIGLICPEDLLATPVSGLDLSDGWVMAGNAFAVYGGRLPMGTRPCVAALPTATAMLRLAPSLLAQGHAVAADQALPTYIRDKVAKTTQERLADKAARAGVANALTAPATTPVVLL